MNFEFEPIGKYNDTPPNNTYDWLKPFMDDEEIDFVEQILTKLQGDKND